MLANEGLQAVMYALKPSKRDRANALAIHTDKKDTRYGLSDIFKQSYHFSYV